ncbi:MAG: glycerol-3-phosphate dehydrogenase/oxidase [Actinobacteria bacterium]|nr:glycerol-3-phosphate dehydrogenase/oxidase [Actinomycetota bacterium]
MNPRDVPLPAPGRESRGRSLARLGTEVFDVVVIGGGVTGCGVALDAASRGLAVALVEKRDFAAGTSSRSSKLIHGGLRYLERMDIGLVREALHERRLLLETIAPHLVKATPFLFPLKRPVWDRFLMGSGLFMYDALAGVHAAVPRHRHLSRAACLRDAPALREDALRGGIRYYDAQVDDARFSVMLARTAIAHGALCVPAVDVTGFLHREDRIAGVRARDVESGDELEVRARTVINATGVWTTEVERLAGVKAPLMVRQSKGVHIVVPKARIDSASALILPTEKSVLFVLPWGDQWIIGTTDTDWRFGLDHPSATRGDIEYLLDHVNAVLRDPLTFTDITGVYVGLRPLLGKGAGDTAKLSREHAVQRSAPGLVSVAGGKYTTYRVMARDAVDAAARDLPFAVAAGRTATLPLLGAVGLAGAEYRLRVHPGATGLAPQRLRHLLGRYGSLATNVLDLVVDEPHLADPLLGAEKYLAAEVRYAALHEGALHVDDVLTRRTHIGFDVRDRGELAVEQVAQLMAPVLGWDQAAVDREITHYRARLVAERAAQSMLDDAASDSARSPVRDLRLPAV